MSQIPCGTRTGSGAASETRASPQKHRDRQAATHAGTRNYVPQRLPRTAPINGSRPQDYPFRRASSRVHCIGLLGRGPDIEFAAPYVRLYVTTMPRHQPQVQQRGHEKECREACHKGLQKTAECAQPSSHHDTSKRNGILGQRDWHASQKGIDTLLPHYLTLSVR